MARYLTARDRAIRTHWALFLRELVGEAHPITPTNLAEEISVNTDRDGSASWQVKAWLEGTRTVSPRLAFEAGEALRTSGISWTSGPLALYAAGYLQAWVQTIARVPPIRTSAEVARSLDALKAGLTIALPMPETAAVLAVFVPLAVLRERNLRYDLGDEAKTWCADARSVLADALAEYPTERLRSAFESREKGMTVLSPIATLAQGAESHINANPIEPAALSALREWAVLNASPSLRLKIATIQLQLQQLRIERLNAIATADETERKRIEERIDALFLAGQLTTEGRKK
jgi:hypothetical protein